MSLCTAAEIAEKKRIALEKLNARKSQMLAQSSNNNNKSKNTTSATSAIQTNNNISKLPTKPSGVFYKSSPSNENKTTTTSVDSATTFLNSLKQSSTFVHRKELRDSAHPYQRPMGAAHQQQATKQYTNTIPTQALKKPILALTPPVNGKSQLAPVFVKAVTCKVYLISAVRFAVQTSGYHAQLIEVFKKMPSKSYDKNTHIWSFGLKDYDMLQEHIKPLKPDIVMGVIPRFVLNLCKAPPIETEPSCLISIQSTLAEKLMPFQKEGVCFGIALAGRVMICDEMGLGKTYQALAIADFYRENWPLFICTTASTRDSWSRHVRELLPNVPLHYVQTLANNQQYIGDAKVLITSYNMMDKHIQNLLARRFGVLIFDESHILKNNKTNNFSAAQRLAKQAKNVILLSGTPALSRPVELFTQLQLIDAKFMNYIDFTSRYCDGQQTHFGWTAAGQSNLEELNIMLKLKYMIRRTKADVLPEMAEKMRETVTLDPALVWNDNSDTKKTLDTFAKHLSACKGREKEEILLKFYAQTAEVKARAVCAYLKTLLKDKIKFIVFAHHHVMLDAVCACLNKSKVDFIRIDGSTRNELRAEYIERFQKKSSCLVAVLSLRACNSGITLTAAEMIIFAELDWNPSTLAQAESRAHRIGQEKPVVCRYLIATKTADDVIWNMLKAKQDVLNRAGLFCEDLQEATHTAAPTGSHKIDEYFSPNKSNFNKSEVHNCSNENISNNTNKKLPEVPLCDGVKSNTDLSEELKNIDEFFQDDDDAFKDLNF